MNRLTPLDTFMLSWLVLALCVLMLPACTKPYTPPPAVEVKVPVPVPCVPVQVPVPAEPKATADMGIFDLTKTALALLSIKTGDNERLRAANANPCPGAK